MKFAGFAHNPAVELAALSLAAAGIWGTLGPFWAMSSESLAGTGAAAGIALINSVGNLGGFVGPSVIGWVEKTTGSFIGGIYYLCASIGVSATILFFLGLGRRERGDLAPVESLPVPVEPVVGARTSA